MECGAWADDEGGAQLVHALAALVDAVAVLPGLPGGRPGAGTEQFEDVDLPDRRRVRGPGLVVDQDDERDLFVVDEAPCITHITGANGDDVGAAGRDLGILTTQLRRVGSAVQSAEVAKEDDDDRLLRPQVAEATQLAVGVGEGDRLEGAEVHT